MEMANMWRIAAPSMQKNLPLTTVGLVAEIRVDEPKQRITFDGMFRSGHDRLANKLGLRLTACGRRQADATVKVIIQPESTAVIVHNSLSNQKISCFRAHAEEFSFSSGAEQCPAFQK